MSIKAMLDDILAMETLTFPKCYPEEEEEEFGDNRDDLGDFWRVQCSHRCHPPATEQAIRQCEHELGFPLPLQLGSFLRVTNGAELFIAPSFDTSHTEYRFLSTEELVALQRRAFKDFTYVLGNDPDFKNVTKFNYLAFCDLGNIDYLAILLEGTRRGSVFFLDHEGDFQPYSEPYADMYFTLADSLEQWFALVRDSGGWGGKGNFGVPV